MNSTPRVLALLFAVTMTVLVSRDAVAKGPVDVIEFSGPELEHSMALIDGDALLEFNPWGQAFLGARLEAPPTGLPEPMTVTMYLDDASGEPKAIYRFEYYPGLGVIYLPGPGDPDYDLNKTTILSANDGYWFEASPDWDAFYETLTRIQPPSTGDAGLK